MSTSSKLILTNAEDPSEAHQAVRHERRGSPSTKVVDLPFALIVAGHSVRGDKLSANHLYVKSGKRSISTGLESAANSLFGSNEWLDADLWLDFSNLSMGLNLRVRKVGETSENELILEIQADEDVRRDLEVVVRSSASGKLEQALLVAELRDAPTRMKRDTANDLSEPDPGRRNGTKRHWFGLGVGLAATLIVLATALASIYNSVFVTRSSFATVSAPRLELLAPVQGQVFGLDFQPGDKVSREDVLFQIESPSLEAELILAEAKIEAIQRERRLALTGLAADSQIEQNVGLAIAEFKALQLRQSELTGYASCDCTVVWRQEPETFVQPGGRVVVLAKSDDESLRVEALVALSETAGLNVGQSAYLRIPNRSDMLPVEIERITLDPLQEPRWGFPDWLRKEPTLASILLKSESELDVDLVGQPLEVMFMHPIRPWAWFFDTLGIEESAPAFEIAKNK